MGYDLWQTMAGILAPYQRYKNNRPTTSTAPLPPLLALPSELQLQIISYFSNTENPVDPEPTLIILRRTHRIFRDIIPSAPYGPPVLNVLDLRSSRYNKLLLAEHKYPYLFPRKMLPCYGCQRVLNRSAFKEWDNLSPGRVFCGGGDYGHGGLLPDTPTRSLPPRGPGTRKCSQCVPAECW